MGSYYDVMQVCVNGHRITDCYASQPQHGEKFCKKCGEATISKCLHCHQEIPGFYHVDGVFSTRETPVPDYCTGCGMAYPWREAAIENLKEILTEGDLSDEEVEAAVKALPDVLLETPKTESASLRFKKIMGKLGDSTYQIAVKVVTDVASETAKKTMGL